MTRHYSLQLRLKEADAAHAHYDMPDTDFTTAVKDLEDVRAEVADLLNTLLERLDAR